MQRIQCIKTIVNCFKLFCSLRVKSQIGGWQIFQGQLPSFQLLECRAFFTYNENGTILNIQGLRLRALNIRTFYFTFLFHCIDKSICAVLNFFIVLLIHISINFVKNLKQATASLKTYFCI